MADEQTPGKATGGSPRPGTPKRPVIKKRVGSKKRREEIDQPDEFMEVGGTVVDWVVGNGKPVGAVVGGLLVALLIWGVYQKLDLGTREDASAVLYAASKQLPDTGGVGESPLSALEPEDLNAKIDVAVAALDDVVAQFDGTPQAQIARIEAGSALYRSGRFEEALPYFEGAASDGGTIGTFASSSKGATLESLERLDDALASYDAVRARTSGALKEQATIDMARVFESKGEFGKARDLYTSFETDFPDSTLLPEVLAKAAAIATR